MANPTHLLLSCLLCLLCASLFPLWISGCGIKLHTLIYGKEQHPGFGFTYFVISEWFRVFQPGPWICSCQRCKQAHWWWVKKERTRKCQWHVLLKDSFLFKWLIEKSYFWVAIFISQWYVTNGLFQEMCNQGTPSTHTGFKNNNSYFIWLTSLERKFP